jgi:hypothetical protein
LRPSFRTIAPAIGGIAAKVIRIELYAIYFILTLTLAGLHFYPSRHKTMSHNLSAHSVDRQLLQTFDLRVKSYCAAAAAAGVSMLALAQPSQAEVVITRTNLPITPVTNSYTSVPIDLNHDGIADFEFSLSDFQYHADNANLGIRPLTGGAVVGVPGSKRSFYASALVRGAKIGPSAHFSSKGFAEIQRSYIPYTPSHYSRRQYGQWGGNVANRYLGVKFLVDGVTHYGWIRFSVNSTRFPISATVTAYAYETIANKPILAGIPSTSGTDTAANSEFRRFSGPSLGLLGLGADGLALWRRDENSPS